MLCLTVFLGLLFFSDAWQLLSWQKSSIHSATLSSRFTRSSSSSSTIAPSRFLIPSSYRRDSSLFSTKTATARRSRSTSSSAAGLPATPSKLINKNIIFIGIAGGMIENILQEYINGSPQTNYQYSNAVFLMNRLPFSTSLLDKLPTISPARQRISIVTYDPSSTGSANTAIENFKILSNDPQSRQSIARIPFFGSSSSEESKEEDIIVTIDDINEYERLQFVKQQQEVVDKGEDQNASPKAIQSTSAQADREYYNQLSSILSSSLRSSSSVKSRYFILQQRSSGANANPITRLSQLSKPLLEQQKVDYSILQYNELIGGIPDYQPVPFSSLPQAEPELELSSQLQSLVVSPYNTKPSRAAITQKKSGGIDEKSVIPPDVAVRKNVAKFLFQYLDKEFLPLLLDSSSTDASSSSVSSPLLKASITSIEGNPLNLKEYLRLFQRLRTFTVRPTKPSYADGRQVTEVFSFDFKQIIRLPQFISWIEDTWYYNALLETKASTIRLGPRPTRVRAVSNTTMILDWVDINPSDLQVYKVGALQFEFILNNQNNPASNAAVEEVSQDKRSKRKRSGAGGVESNRFIPDQLIISRIRYPVPFKNEESGELVNETLLLERLIEAVNKNVYKKMFCLPLDEDDVGDENAEEN